MGTDFLTVNLICLMLTYISEESGATGTTRDFYARSIRLDNKKLDATPIMTTPSSSRVKCLENCIYTMGCVAFNYGRGGQCELLDTYVCEDAASLVPATDFIYYDVEDTLENMGIYDTKASCIDEGRCSPKCAPCQWTSQFVETPGQFIVGYTKESIPSVTVEECKQRCVAATTFLCKSADYSHSQTRCFLSHLNTDNAPPDTIQSTSTYTYLHRICQ